MQVAASLQRQRLVEVHKSEQAAKQEEGAAAQVRIFLSSCFVQALWQKARRLSNLGSLRELGQ